MKSGRAAYRQGLTRLVRRASEGALHDLEIRTADSPSVHFLPRTFVSIGRGFLPKIAPADPIHVIGCDSAGRSLKFLVRRSQFGDLAAHQSADALESLSVSHPHRMEKQSGKIREADNSKLSGA